MSSSSINPNGLYKPDESYEGILSHLKEKVDGLYFYRDHYFESNPIEKAFNKHKDVEEQLEVALDLLDQNENCAVKGNRAKYYYLKGRALNVLPKYNKEAEELLSKAVKLDPKLVEAWNELGECYWKNDNMKEAENCFNGALNYGKNKISLRNLSMITRQKSSASQEERKKNVEYGLNLAKEAVQLDILDGLSWVVLGNAHLSSFFGIQQSPSILKQCLSAYIQAEKDVVAKSNPDLHYNKGITHKYEEEFQLALESFNTACLYEPSWEPPKIKEKQLTRYLQDITELVATKGKMKAKRLHQIIQSIDSEQLGPYSGGSYTSSNGESTVKLTEVNLQDLKPGINEEAVVLGKVVCSAYNEDKVPFTFCMIDKTGTCVAVTIFNIAESRGVIIGDSVGIPEPFVTDVLFKYKENEFKFRLIRVETPRVLVVNRKKLGRDVQAGVQMSLFKKFD